MKRLAVLLAAGLIAGAIPVSAGAQSPPLPVIRIASAADDDVTPVLWADKMGLFRQAGIEIVVQRTNTGSAVAAAVIGGAMDIGKSSMLPIVLAHARGIPLTIVAPGGLYTENSTESGIIVLRDAPIHTASDLEGKIVSVPALNDLQWLSTQAWIDKRGGNSKRVSFIEQPGTSVGIALDTGRIVAGTLTNPAFHSDLATGKYRVLGRQIDGIAKRVMISGWFATTDYVANNADTVRKFGEIMNRAAAYVGSHHEETVALLSSFSGIEPATIKAMARVYYAPSLDRSMVQPLIDTAAKYGSIPAAFDARELFSQYAYRKS